MSKIRDDAGKQLYEESLPHVFPDGSEFSVYSSPENQRMVLRHTSGSHIEFKADGSVFIKAIKDLHINSSVESDTEGEEASTIYVEGDMNYVTKGDFRIQCKNFDVSSLENTRLHANGEMNTTANNTTMKSTEQMSIEPTKSLYVSTKEMRESVASRTSAVGTSLGEGGKPTGGVEITEVMGNAVIQNLDPKGGITIKSAGYLNIIAGAERIDMTGDPAALSPKYISSVNGKATYTHIVRPNPGPNPRGIPGSAYFECGPGGYTQKITGPTLRVQTGPSTHNYLGPFKELYGANKLKTVIADETANITGIYKVTAAKIFLN
jgi:hypothetical protein